MLAYLTFALLVGQRQASARLVHALAHGEPAIFSKALRKARRELQGQFDEHPHGRWTEFVSTSCAVELGPIESGDPRKITVQCAFASREDARVYLEALLVAIGRPLVPRLQDAGAGPLTYRGALVVRRRLVGVEFYVFQDATWHAAMVLADGPRTVVPNR